jgi:hypothetical protein
MLRVGRLACIAMIGFFGSTLPAVAHGRGHIPDATRRSVWRQFRHDAGRSGFNAAEHKIGRTNVAALSLLWSQNEHDFAEAGGTVYAIGAWTHFAHLIRRPEESSGA